MTSREINNELGAWIAKNERPLVVPMDERTIGDMFSSKKPGLVLFNHLDSKSWFNELEAAASESTENLIFV